MKINFTLLTKRLSALVKTLSVSNAATETINATTKNKNQYNNDSVHAGSFFVSSDLSSDLSTVASSRVALAKEEALGEGRTFLSGSLRPELVEGQLIPIAGGQSEFLLKTKNRSVINSRLTTHDYTLITPHPLFLNFLLCNLNL